MVADVAPQTQQAWNLAANSGKVGQAAQNASMAGYLNTLGSAPAPITAAQAALSQAALAAPTTAAQSALAQTQAAPTVNAQQAALSTLGGMNLQPYMNPYTQDVINKTLPIMNQSLAQQQNALQNQANQASAFGGSRQGITQGVLGAQGALSEAQMAAQLNAANFAQAQQAGEFDVGQANTMGQFNANQMNQVGMFNENQLNQVGMYNAGQANQVGMYNAGQQNQVGMYNQGQANAMNQFNAGQANQMGEFNAGAQNTAAYQNQMAALQQEQLNNAASAGLGTLGSQQMQNNIANYGMLTSAGGFEQQQAQNQINAQMAKFQQAFNYPQQQLGMMESSLGMTPYDTATSGSSQSTTQQTQSNPMQAALSGMQTLGGLFGSGGALSPLLAMSDRRIKKNIVHLGKDPITRVPIKAFNYKGAAPGTPKIIGPLAQDVERHRPGSTVRIGGILHVPRGTLAAATPSVAGLPQHVANMMPPSSPGVARAIGMLGRGTPGVLAANATPPSRNIIGPRGRVAPIRGALAGA
jgi:hypothetical protein